MSVYRPSANLLEAFLRTVRQQPVARAIRCRWDPRLAELTWREYAERVSAVAAALRDLGLARGEVVLILLPNCAAFHVADLGVLAAGAVPVSLYGTASVQQVGYVLRHSRARTVVAAAGEPSARVREAARVQGLDVRVIEAGPGATGTTLEALATSTVRLDLPSAAADLSTSDLATVIYTSGTTGEPKGVRVTHGNVIAAFEATIHIVGLDGAGTRLVSYLPMAHVAERMSSHYNHLLYGSEVHCCPVSDQVYDMVAEVSPHIWFGPPRIWEKLALRLDLSDGDTARASLERCGLGELRVAVSGAAPLPPLLFAQLRSAGLPLSEVYGLSETTGVMTWDHDEVRAGSVGRALPRIEVRLAADGEIECRGPVVFAGYLHDSERTAEAFAADGWFRTGDLGAIDEEGYLSVVGRKKELLVTSGGKNVAPAPLEARLGRLPGVAQVMVVGDDLPFVAALVVTEPWVRATGAELAAWTARLRADIAGVNDTTSRAESIRRVAILEDEWTPASGLLTPTMKLKRAKILDRYREVVDDMYAGGGLDVSPSATAGRA